MNWLFGKMDCTVDDIKNIEDSLSIKLPQDFVTIVLSYNGAYPDENIYDLSNEKEKMVQCLLSCKNESMGILDITNRINIQNIVPFIKDPSGNYICFQFENMHNYQVVLWDHDTNDINMIAKNFTDFLQMLYKK